MRGLKCKLIKRKLVKRTFRIEVTQPHRGEEEATKWKARKTLQFVLPPLSAGHCGVMDMPTSTRYLPT